MSQKHQFKRDIAFDKSSQLDLMVTLMDGRFSTDVSTSKVSKRRLGDLKSLLV